MLGSATGRFSAAISLILCLLFHNAALTSAQFFFREANARVAKLLEKDRPCNLLLGYKDRLLKTPEIIEKYGYPSERHWTTTADGYILELHRIPAPAKPVVFLLHGVFSSSRDYVINCDRRALAFKLHDVGYDVWMGNYRGNTYCRNHTRLSDRESKFWNFSVDQIGYFDAPAMLDYVLNLTGRKDLSFVAHSLGNQVALAMLCQRPEYNDKINVWLSTGSAFDMQDSGRPFKGATLFLRQLEWLLGTFNHGEALPPNLVPRLQNYLSRMCRREGRRQDQHGICAVGMYAMYGYAPTQIPAEMMSLIMGGLPSTSSAKVFSQVLQWILGGRLAFFDEGPRRNLRRYGDVRAPFYPLENLDTDLYLFWAENDMMLTKKSMDKTDKLLATFPKMKDRYHMVRVNLTSFNHMDFIHGKDADIYVYNPMIQILSTYESNAGATGGGKFETGPSVLGEDSADKLMRL